MATSDNPFDAVLGGSDNPFDAVLRKPRPVPGVKPAPSVAPSGDPLVSTLQGAGFKGDALRTAWAIAKRESGGKATAFNPDTSTGDQSYGLFQINMLNELGPSRRQSYGLKKNEDLFDPATNARVAFAMSKGGKDFGAWGIGPNAYRKMPALDFSGFPGGQKQPVTPAAVKTVSRPQVQPQLEESDNPFAAILGGTNDDNPFAMVVAPPKGTSSVAPIDRVVEGNSVGAQAVKQAATQLGKPYVFGSGPDTASFDCSDLVQWSYRQLGINIPRDTWGQQKALPLKSWADLKVGDPLYRKSGGHVVIYAGNGKVIAAPRTGTVVQYQPLANFPQDKYEVRAVR